VILAEIAAHKKDDSRHGAKAQTNTRREPLLFFASFAHFAALRETGLAVPRSIHSFEGLRQDEVVEPLS
jgi:hypothetical protein